MYHIIVNPASKSGRGQKIWDSLLPILAEKNVLYQAYFTTGAGHASQIADMLSCNLTAEHITVIVLGGDGTINEVLQGLKNIPLITLGYIPTGSSNDLARDIGLSRNPMEALLHILDNPKVKLMDLGIVQFKNGFFRKTKKPIYESDNAVRLFAVGCGIGFDAAVCEEAMDSPIKTALNNIGLGKLTYLGIALRQLVKAPTVSCDLTLDGNAPIRFPSLLFAASMIHRYEGGGFMFCPDAIDHDGLLDICLAVGMPLHRALRILPTAFSGKHLRFSEIFNYRCREIRIQTSTPLWVQTDGEVNVYADDIQISLLPDKIHFIY